MTDVVGDSSSGVTRLLRVTSRVNDSAGPPPTLWPLASAAIDGRKLGEVQGKLSAARAELAQTGVKDPEAALQRLSPDERAVHASAIQGDRQTLIADAVIPAMMAIIYLCLLVYFRSIGGYKVVHIRD